MKISQDFKCFIHLHKYVFLKEEDIKDYKGNIIGKAIISRCSNCGKINSYRIKTVENY